MKKVRFETFADCDGVESPDCHSPRPFTGLEVSPATAKNPHEFYSYSVPKLDPVERYERSNSSPYSVANKTTLANNYDTLISFQPSNDLDLSMLDIGQEPRRYPFRKSMPVKPPVPRNNSIINLENMSPPKPRMNVPPPVLQPIENIEYHQGIPVKDSSFFMTRENMHSVEQSTNYVKKHFHGAKLGKENVSARKVEITRNGIPNPFATTADKTDDALTLSCDKSCNCHHCNRQTEESIHHCPQHQLYHPLKVVPYHYGSLQKYNGNSDQCHCSITCHLHYKQTVAKNPYNFSPDVNKNYGHKTCSAKPDLQNAVYKKAMAIEKFECRKSDECTDMEKSSANEKREPTVADLIKIIKLQNEQLQLLQEKVEKFISTNANKPQPPLLPVQNYVTEHVALETVDNNRQISIGVMTSFEMVRTSTVINKEIVKQTNSNTQIQCNRSQVNVKEVAFCQPSDQNFLDGILPVESTQSAFTCNDSSPPAWHCKTLQNSRCVPEEKTLNECSLYNVQVDNATTPLLSPEQTMYLDVKDYSDSESTSSDQSNVGWTYYNKVMAHVNNVLQDSDMPSSASALFRNTRQQCIQMHVDKTNISVTKRVKFDEEGQGARQSQYYQHLNHVPSTDISMKMNQLAAKYLKKAPETRHPVTVKDVAATAEMSFATRKYMERHQILQGLPSPSRPPVLNMDYGKGLGSSPTYEIPKFLDITALKQQPKLL